MADENDIDDVAEGASSKPTKSKSKFSGGSGLVVMLSIVLAAIAAIIFMVLTSVITFKLMSGSRVQAPASAVSDVFNQTPEYDTTEPLEIRGRTSDRIPVTFSVRVVLGYDVGDDKTAAEIARKHSQLQDLMRGFFSSKRAEELLPANEESIKAELQQRINRIFSQGRIRTVLFTEFLIDA